MPRNLLFENEENAMVVITVRVPEWVRDALRAEGKATKRSASDVIRLMLLERYETQSPHRESE